MFYVTKSTKLKVDILWDAVHKITHMYGISIAFYKSAILELVVLFTLCSKPIGKGGKQGILAVIVA